MKTFRHAISLDEHRVKFKANLFEKVVAPDVHTCDLAFTSWGTRADQLKSKLSRLNFRKGRLEFKKPDKYSQASQLQDEYTNTNRKTDVLEVWFAGCHTGVFFDNNF